MISAADALQVSEDDDLENSAPNWLIFDQQTSRIFIINSAGVLIIKSPLLKCTIQEIIVSSMNRKQLLFQPLFDPWVRRQVFQWKVDWFLVVNIEISEISNFTTKLELNLSKPFIIYISS